MNLTRKESMVLRFIYEVTKDIPLVTVKQVAEFLRISPPSAFELLNRLAEAKGLLLRIERKGYILTRSGRAVAQKLVAVHRILETVFCRIFGMDADCACEVASHVDFIIDIDHALRAMKMLGNPEVCPHNKRIPIGEEID